VKTSRILLIKFLAFSLKSIAMIKQFLQTILLIVLCFITINSYSQITRGAVPGEIYISNEWYVDTQYLHSGIFHSTDNGEHISPQYNNIETPPPGEMRVGKVLGDATTGALYNYGHNELWVSFDYGESWEFIESYGSGRYASGCINGGVYKCCVNPQGTIWHSTDYGNEFIEVVENAKYILEVGVLEGNVYGLDGIGGIGFDLHFSENYGGDFITIPIDSTVAYWSPSGHYPQISRGTEPGELYLVSWWPDYHYKIFHSVDTGYTWTQQYESGYIDIYNWGVQYTAGREPGSFYVKRATPDPTFTHTMVYIDYSSDYGQTFTTYVHDLTPNFTSINTNEITTVSLSNFPNPFTDYTTISFNISENNHNPMLNIYDIYGNPVKHINVTGKKTQIWDAKDNNGKKVKNGFYFYNISYENFISQFNKLLIVN